MNVDLVIPAYGDINLDRCLRSIRKQRLSRHEISSVTVVDDGSDPPIKAQSDYDGLPLKIRRNRTNFGRSAARNIGASAGSARGLIFLDADLCLSSADSVEVLLDHLDAINGVVLGTIDRRYPPFWAWYESRSLSKQLARSGPSWAGTTAFIAMSRTLFSDLKGFDEGFKEYGFEDRDLLYRAYLSGISIEPSPHATAEHDGEIQALRVSIKLNAAGRWTAQRFRIKHPDAYRQLPYSKIDLSEAPPIIRCIAIWIYSFAKRVASLAARFKDRNRLPYRLRSAAVRLLSAVAFAAGTARCELPSKHSSHKHGAQR